MSNENDITKVLFNEKGPSELLTLIDEEEKLSPEAEQLLIDIGASMLAKIVEDASFSAKSRGSDVIEQSDIQFISDPWIRNPTNETKQEDKEEIFYKDNTGSPEHQQILQMIHHFNETNNQ